MIIAILLLLVISIILNVVFYVKLSKANETIKDLLNRTVIKDTVKTWENFGNIMK